ncbi:hypothetical protein HMPREF1584_01216 [Gardnerella vaginalis JCP8481A]|uniref:Uncharacterized protein n=1 Tax=Gardnerella vaginalis TaxID=2702 RepID=A0A133NSI1_GARVA|nr:hypothetical protein HMPREF1584_01216 [Gardnerella vaginalis JCP8481A]EPI42213.1 hypothetical protein HMPREF1585_01014 [Gardnerella vaginalis JCP8481B]KXA19239.1 hypothetical protein HMPREF3208_01123 [Gardnerella vaginalis]
MASEQAAAAKAKALFFIFILLTSGRQDAISIQKSQVMSSKHKTYLSILSDRFLQANDRASSLIKIQ